NPLRYTDPSGHGSPLPQREIDVSGWNKWVVGALRVALFVLGGQTSVEEDTLKIEPSLTIPFGADLIIEAPAAATASRLGDMVDDAAAQLTDDAADAARVANRLTELGTHSDETADVVKALAEVSTRNGRAQGGFTVLGSFPEYIDIAKLEGLTYFDMPEESWRILSEAGDEYAWAVNRQFLDDSVAAGHSFVVTLGEGRTPGKYLQREIQHLLDNGYEWVEGILVRR
ncbi:MAG: hypothetical protein QHJ74_17305, partial [Anaerolineae bacterium]|nr:hypothetical protein [Anaerolineae bacterium]